jgi:hydroxypyruvate reductase
MRPSRPRIPTSCCRRICARAERPGDLPGRRQGRGAHGGAAERHYLDALGLDPSRLTGIATTRHGHGVPTRRIRVIEAGHPVPDEAGLKAADDTLRLAAEATADDLLLVLLSGGGSAETGSRRSRGVSFVLKQQVNRALLRSGAPIGRDEHRPQTTCRGSRAAGWRARDNAPKSSRWRSRTFRVTTRRRLHRDRRCRIRPRWRTPGAGRAGTISAIDDAVRRALEDPRNESCKPGDPRLRPRAIRDDCETEGFARCRDQGCKGRWVRGDRSRRRPRRRGARRCRPTMPSWR